MVTNDEMRKIVQEALREVNFEHLTERGTDQTDQGWKVKFWLDGPKGTIGREIPYMQRDAAPEKIKSDLVRTIREMLPEWKKLVG